MEHQLPEVDIDLDFQPIIYERDSRKKTKGELFKEKNGYSKTIKRLSTDKGLTVEDYKRIRRQRKKVEKGVQAAKHDAAKSGRKSKATAVKTASKSK